MVINEEFCQAPNINSLTSFLFVEFLFGTLNFFEKLTQQIFGSVVTNHCDL